MSYFTKLINTIFGIFNIFQKLVDRKVVLTITQPFCDLGGILLYLYGVPLKSCIF